MKRVEQVERKTNLSTSSKSKGPGTCTLPGGGGPASGVIGSIIGIDMVGFCFGRNWTHFSC